MCSFNLPLSILNFLDNAAGAVELGCLAESLGYHRYWIGEHHNEQQCGNPVLAACALGCRTKTLRVGTGATSLLLRNPFLVAEDARIANELTLGRFDLGVAPAVSHSPLIIEKILRGNKVVPGEFGARLLELRQFLAYPYCTSGTARPVWLMAVNEESASIAGELGLGLCTSFHHAQSRQKVAQAVGRYKTSFQPSKEFPDPCVIVVASGIWSDDFHTDRDLSKLANDHLARSGPGRSFFGTTESCAKEIHQEALHCGADEVMVLSLLKPDYRGGTETMIRQLARVWNPGDFSMAAKR